MTKNYTQLKALANSSFPDEGAEKITPEKLRSYLVDSVDTMRSGDGALISPYKKSTRSLSGYEDVVSTAAYLDRTYRMAMAAPADFVGIRIILRNISNSAINWTGKIYAAPSTGFTANNPTGSWTQVTFNGRDTSGSFSIPAGFGNVQRNTASQGVMISDWIPVNSVPRADGQEFPIIYLSGYVSASQGNVTLMGNSSLPSAEWATSSNAVVQGRVFKALSATGDFANSSSFAGVDGYGSPFVEIEFLHSKNVLTMCAMGDSITNGDTTTMRMSSPVHIASTLMNSSTSIVSAENQGFSSQNTNSFADRLSVRMLGRTPPSIVIYSAYSPNDFGQSQGKPFAVSQMMDNLFRAIELCKSNSVQIAISTGLPSSLSESEDINRRNYNEFIRSLCAKNNFILVDYDLAMKDSTDQTQINPLLRSDAIHPNLDGYKVMGQVLATALDQFKNDYFA
ncbi:gp33 putative acylhydrolase [Iodobacter phage PhiPLPE]|uniref:Gp33 putative acylhydrolase n=1 Tax=Iodobacter phage PhiPLPE TaxID=551895 RepID=B5AX52_9CAUD|nr:gp33 putative acylhydrolase [Iodobacter phage PhiPLPE]ACG60355.1 gp33 putative acylhydrolase [Iodobacter phage PhiPLPE]